MKLFSKLAIILCFGIVLAACSKTDSETKNGTAKQPQKTEQNSQPANMDRINEIVKLAEAKKQWEKDSNAKIAELAKLVKCANTVTDCKDTLRTLVLNKNVMESLVTLSKSMPIVIAMRQGPFDKIYVSGDGWLVIVENPDLETVKKYLGVK